MDNVPMLTLEVLEVKDKGPVVCHFDVENNPSLLIDGSEVQVYEIVAVTEELALSIIEVDLEAVGVERPIIEVKKLSSKVVSDEARVAIRADTLKDPWRAQSHDYIYIHAVTPLNDLVCMFALREPEVLKLGS
jgi:hypothetical protein